MLASTQGLNPGQAWSPSQEVTDEATLPSQVELNFDEAIPSFRESSHTTATIPQQDFTVFNTDSSQSKWLPSSSPSLPASSAQQNNSFAPQQDFVLFDQPEPQRTNVNRTVSSPAPPSATAFGSLNINGRRRSSHNQADSASPNLQNQRVAQIIQATGHQISSSAFTNRFKSSVQNQSQQFYASFSAPSSTAAVNQQNRPRRPPVPLFTEGIGNQQTAAKMDLHGKHLLLPAPDDGQSSCETDALNVDDFPPLEGGASTTAYSSPGIPAYDMTASSASSTNLGTVSPQDLFRDFTSAPNSTTLTNLTSPSLYNESPAFDSLDVSPAFDVGDFGSTTDPWFPLFPPENTAVSIAAADQSPAQQTEELEVVEKAPRRKSSNSPTTSHGRHSSVSGVNSRRRDKPLPPIVVDDPSDTVAMKRARNTLAARKSRERKAQRLEDLEEKIMKLEQERDHWKRIALGRGGSTG
ncbi:hypothetical protein DL765_009341 [Monosporascus sp. GIB2]|nr:hypothetical protein DL765_009341 [Monosporascus sp. GIB2]